jgi:hypothetical protein
MIDEIYIAKRVEHSGGKVQGLTSDGSVASTLLCFMVKSLACKYMDVVAIYPMAKLTAEKQFECYKEVRELLKTAPLNIAAISVDNASTNRRFLTDYLCQGELKTHIVDSVTGQPTFLIIDPTHDLKNIYNNFQSRKKFECPPMGSDLPDGCSANCRATARRPSTSLSIARPSLSAAAGVSLLATEITGLSPSAGALLGTDGRNSRGLCTSSLSRSPASTSVVGEIFIMETHYKYDDRG